jgi:cell division transport system permease protein
MSQSGRYFVRKALLSIQHSLGLSFLTAATIAASLLVLAFYAMLLQNLEGIALVWGRSAALTAYVKQDVPTSAWNSLAEEIAQHAGVEKAILVTPGEALERFKSRGEQARALVEGVERDLLPAAFEVSLSSDFNDLKHVAALGELLAGHPFIEEVDYGQEEFQRLEALVDLLRVGGGIGVVLIALATAFIVANTIRLIVHSRRHEISILRLVGATDGFVRLPFLVEGAFWGAAGAFMALVLLWLSDWIIAPRISVAVADVLGGLQVRLFSATVGWGICFLGIFLGIAGSALAVRRFLEADTEP